jgi:thioesterase domain-containing protein
MSKIAVYMMPGLAASSLIFEKISLPEVQFEIFLLEWKIPEPNETLKSYAKRMAKNVVHNNVVLIGVSFGGILVQEMSAFLNVRKVIIISSVKNNNEFPLKMKMAKSTKAYKLIPTSLLINVESLAKFSFGEVISQRIKLYEKYLSIRDKRYLDWAIEQVVCWDRNITDQSVVHIHGDADDVFPIKNIDNAIVIKNGTHIMILNKHKWLNENLPDIILK